MPNHFDPSIGANPGPQRRRNIMPDDGYGPQGPYRAPRPGRPALIPDRTPHGGQVLHGDHVGHGWLQFEQESDRVRFGADHEAIKRAAGAATKQQLVLFLEALGKIPGRSRGGLDPKHYLVLQVANAQMDLWWPIVKKLPWPDARKNPQRRRNAILTAGAFGVADILADGIVGGIAYGVATTATRHLIQGSSHHARRQNPAFRLSTKDPRTMTPAQVNAELDKLSVLSSRVNDAMIAAGRGHWKWDEVHYAATKQADPLSIEAVVISNRERALHAEIEARQGPSMRSRMLPGMKRRANGMAPLLLVGNRPIRRRNSDEELRALERAASLGDPGAIQRLTQMRERSGATVMGLTMDERIVLGATLGLKSSYGDLGKSHRFVESHRYTGITPARWFAAKASLQAKKLLNKAGAAAPGVFQSHRPATNYEDIGRQLGVDPMRREFWAGDAKKAFDAYEQGGRAQNPGFRRGPRGPNKAQWMATFEDEYVRLRPEAAGKIKWSELDYPFMQGMDPVETARRMAARQPNPAGFAPLLLVGNSPKRRRNTPSLATFSGPGGEWHVRDTGFKNRHHIYQRLPGNDPSRPEWSTWLRSEEFPGFYGIRAASKIAKGLAEGRKPNPSTLADAAEFKIKEAYEAFEQGQGRAQNPGFRRRNPSGYWQSKMPIGFPVQLRDESHGQYQVFTRPSDVLVMYHPKAQDEDSSKVGLFRSFDEAHAEIERHHHLYRMQPNPGTLADAAESWAAARGMRVPARGSAAWSGMYVAWQRGGMRRNPGAAMVPLLLVGNPGRSVPTQIRKRNYAKVASTDLRLPPSRVKKVMSVEDAMRVSGMKEAIRRYKLFHGCEPENVVVYDDGRPGNDAGFILGRSPEITYTDVPPESNKGEAGGNDGVLWVHQTSKKTPTYLAHLVGTKNTILIGDMAHNGVRDWLSEKNER